MPEKAKDNDFELKELKTLSVGDSFGEMGLLSEKNYRTATIITKEHCDLAVLLKSDFLDTIGKLLLLDYYKGTKYIEEITEKINFLTTVSFFKKWN